MKETTKETTTPSALPSARWLTRNVFAIGMLSLFSDMGHELVTALLPIFLASFGNGAAALGTIEGFSDAFSSIIKLWMSHYSDRIGKRKPILFVGYFATALLGAFAFVNALWQILLLRVFAWMGRGARGPVRDALLTDSVPKETRGRAFGFQSAMDTLGAIAGPTIGLSLVGVLPIRHIFLISFLPGAITIFIVLFLVHEAPIEPQQHIRIMASLRELPPAFKRYVAAVGVFGLGNFAHTLLVLRAVALLTPIYGKLRADQIGLALYILHNVLYASGSYPVGILADRFSKMKLLSVGYALFGVCCLGFIKVDAHLGGLVVLFVLAGVYIAIVDTVERATAADLLPSNRRGTGFGALALVNSFGDLISSLVVGLLWSHVSYAAGFWYGAVLTLLGALALLGVSSTLKTSKLSLPKETA